MLPNTVQELIALNCSKMLRQSRKYSPARQPGNKPSLSRKTIDRWVSFNRPQFYPPITTPHKRCASSTSSQNTANNHEVSNERVKIIPYLATKARSLSTRSCSSNDQQPALSMNLAIRALSPRIRARASKNPQARSPSGGRINQIRGLKQNSAFPTKRIDLGCLNIFVRGEKIA